MAEYAIGRPNVIGYYIALVSFLNLHVNIYAEIFEEDIMQNWIIEASKYPRPDRVRADCQILDGEWDFAFDRLNVGTTSGWFKGKKWTDKINVPYCVEAELSGVYNRGLPGTMWYHRTFDAPAAFRPGKRLLLHVGAADYYATVWVNGRKAGEHEGGYTSFSIDITDLVQSGSNDLTIQVVDSISPRIPRGKQSMIVKPTSIFYTNVSGIWQTVYLEVAGAAHVSSFIATTSPATGATDFDITLSGTPGKYDIEVSVEGPSGDHYSTMATAEMPTALCGRAIASVTVSDPKLWAPAASNLYRVTFSVKSLRGEVLDTMQSYFAFRTIEVRNGEILLNGKKFYQKLFLNQGYFPRGHYTPADYDLFRNDVQQVLDMGFNGVRMHQKIEDPRFMFWADALGIVMWEEMPSAFWFCEKMRTSLRTQWLEAIARDRNHPCIITWAPFNESWGVVFRLTDARCREFVREIASMTRRIDPSRPVSDNSGFEHVDTDILDIHHYLKDVDTCRKYYAKLRDPKNMEYTTKNVYERLNVKEVPACPLAPTIKYQGQPLLVSEYGGFGFYKTNDNPLFDNFRDYTLAIAEDDIFWGYCYTQQYDTEQEANGILNFDRSPKIPIEDIKSVSTKVDEIISARWHE